MMSAHPHHHMHHHLSHHHQQLAAQLAGHHQGQAAAAAQWSHHHHHAMQQHHHGQHQIHPQQHPHHYPGQNIYNPQNLTFDHNGDENHETTTDLDQHQQHLQQQQQQQQQQQASSPPTSSSSPSPQRKGKTVLPPTKSTKGASKMRRDMINSEISVLRDLLPLPSSTRQRLSQLQLMALVCVYVRKSNYFDQVFKTIGKPHHYQFHDLPSFGFSKALNGFLMMTTQTGKLLYISDNAAEYLGHSMEDLLIHGDSVYDIIDKQDHNAIQSELMRSPEENSPTTKRIFLCRMNVSRNSRRQMRFGDQKVVLIEGRFSGVLPLCSRNEPVFISWCTPIAMPETRESVVQGATNIYTATHGMDLKFRHIDENGEHYLGYQSRELKGVSLYNLLHPDCVKEVQSKHQLITQSENERACILLVRLQNREGFFVWCHLVMQVKDGGGSNGSNNNNNSSGDQQQSPNNSNSYIVCTNQILTREEAEVMKANSWLYHYYMVQSRLQYNLAYGGQPSTIAALYPQMMHMINPASFTAIPEGASDQYTPNGSYYGYDMLPAQHQRPFDYSTQPASSERSDGSPNQPNNSEQSPTLFNLESAQNDNPEDFSTPKAANNDDPGKDEDGNNNNKKK